MKAVSCPQVQRSLWRYADRELPAQEQVAVSAHIAECAMCRAAYHECASESRLVREAILGPWLQEQAFGDAFTERCMEGLRGLDGLRGEMARRRASKPVFSKAALWARPPVWVGLAAALVIVAPILAVLILGGLQPGPVGWFEVRGEPVGTGRLDARGRVLLEDTPLAAEGPYFASRVFRVPAESRLMLKPVGCAERAPQEDADAPWALCEVVGPAFVIVDPDAAPGRFLLRMPSGSLDARVAKLEPEEEFEIRTPHATARVVGTAFRVHVGEGKTSLWVREGTVAFAPLDEAAEKGPRDVPAGESWAIGAQGSSEPLSPVVDTATDPSASAIAEAPSARVPPALDGGVTEPSPAEAPSLEGQPTEGGERIPPTRRLLNGREDDLDTPVTPEAPDAQED